MKVLTMEMIKMVTITEIHVPLSESTAVNSGNNGHIEQNIKAEYFGITFEYVIIRESTDNYNISSVEKRYSTNYNTVTNKYDYAFNVLSNLFEDSNGYISELDTGLWEFPLNTPRNVEVFLENFFNESRDFKTKVTVTLLKTTLWVY